LARVSGRLGGARLEAPRRRRPRYVPPFGAQDAEARRHCGRAHGHSFAARRGAFRGRVNGFEGPGSTGGRGGPSSTGLSNATNDSHGPRPEDDEESASGGLALVSERAQRLASPPSESLYGGRRFVARQGRDRAPRRGWGASISREGGGSGLPPRGPAAMRRDSAPRGSLAARKAESEAGMPRAEPGGTSNALRGDAVGGARDSRFPEHVAIP